MKDSLARVRLPECCKQVFLMYGTTGTPTSSAPRIADDAVCGRYLQLPGNPLRQAEGGLRLSGKFRQSIPSQPLVSVITVVLNQEATVRQCITSVLEQTYANIEYLVIDGASSDRTPEILGENAGALDYYVSEPDTGIYNAMNKGLSLATGDYILVLNSDDWYRADAVEALLKAAVRNNADVTHADAVVVNDKGTRQHILKGWLNDGIFTRGAGLRHETMLVKREIYERFGYYDESYPIIADYAYMMALYHAGVSFFHLQQPLLYFRNTGISNTANRQRSNERKRIFKGYFPFLDEEDLEHFKMHGRIPVDIRLALIEKHKGASELFARSMAYNIATQAEFETRARLRAQTRNHGAIRKQGPARRDTRTRKILRAIKGMIRA